MSHLQDKIRDIEEQKVGASHKRVLLVEGVDDVHAITEFAQKKDANMLKQWVITEAGKKYDVLAMLEKKPEWLGIVDRDEWTLEVIREKEEACPNLWILPRFCIESYVIVPSELWAALPQNQKLKINGGQQALEEEIRKYMDRWLKHGVLWSTINPLLEGLRAKGFKEKLLKPQVALDEATIQNTLKEWHDYLNPDKLWSDYEQQLASVQDLPFEDQLKCWVHGKLFFNSVINNVLNQSLGVQKSSKRRIDLFKSCPTPNDFDGLWQRMSTHP
ncbi:MAG: hypothetical protein Q9M09_05990 [Mariprofundaceae bacterium]|nr:hypothetical protein [Mariprofundaceae bacterium]